MSKLTAQQKLKAVINQLLHLSQNSNINKKKKVKFMKKLSLEHQTRHFPFLN